MNIISAKYAHPSGYNVLLVTDKGEMNVSRYDDPEVFDEVIAWVVKGNEIQPFEIPAQPNYTIKSAIYANEQRTAAVAETVEAWAVAYECENPDQWIALMDSTDGKIEDYPTIKNSRANSLVVE